MITNDKKYQIQNKYKKMVSSGGKSKTDSFAWVLLQAYYQNEIPFPVPRLKDYTIIRSESNLKTGSLA